jgi:hypothetical protein
MWSAVNPSGVFCWNGFGKADITGATHAKGTHPLRDGGFDAFSQRILSVYGSPPPGLQLPLLAYLRLPPIRILSYSYNVAAICS